VKLKPIESILQGVFLTVVIIALFSSEATALDFVWQMKTPMPTARYLLKSAVVDGKIYCIGGWDGYEVVSALEVYDPDNDTWETKSPMPQPLAGHSCAEWNGKIYACGDYNSAMGGDLNIVEVYDIANDTWTFGRNMPTPRRGSSAAAVDGKIYVIGGYNESQGGLSMLEVYDIENDTWTTKSPMPTERGNFGIAVVSNEIYCIGGYNGVALDVVEIYNPSTDSWETKTSMLIKRTDLACAVVNNKIYAIGGLGVDSGDHLKTVEEYDIENDSWVVKNPLNYRRLSLTAATVNNRIYAIGGWSNDFKDYVEEGILITATEPTLISPADGEHIYTNQPLFRWQFNPVKEGDYQVAFHVLVSGGSNFPPTASPPDYFDSGVQYTSNTYWQFPENNSYGVNLTVGTGYYWTVQVKHSDGFWSDYNREAVHFYTNRELTKIKIVPNPFNPLREPTKIQYTLIQPQKVELNIYNLAGEKVRSFSGTGNSLLEDEYYIEWDGKNQAGKMVASGVYFAHLKADDFKKIAKIAVVK